MNKKKTRKKFKIDSKRVSKKRKMMNQNDCEDSNDVLTSNVLNSCVALGGSGDDNEYGHLHHESSGLGGISVNGGGGHLHSDDDELPHYLREQDRFLPIANVAKLMKKQYQKEVK